MFDKRYYRNIDEMPLFNWRLCQDGDFLYARKNIEEGEEELDETAWEVIYDSYLKEFGLGKDYERVLELRSRIAELQCVFIENDDNFIRNEINYLKDELHELLNREVEGDSDTALIHLSKWMGFKIDEKTTTVKEFYKMIQEFQKEAERKTKAA